VVRVMCDSFSLSQEGVFLFMICLPLLSSFCLLFRAVETKSSLIQTLSIRC